MGNNKSNKTEMQPKNKSVLKQTLSQVTSGTKTKDSAGEIAEVYSVNERINELSSLMRNNTEHTLRTRKCRQLLNFTMVWAKIYLASFTRQPYTSYKLLSSWGDLTSGNGQHPKLAGPVRQQVYWSEHELPSLHFIVTLASSPPTWNNIKKHHLNSTFNSL